MKTGNILEIKNTERDWKSEYYNRIGEWEGKDLPTSTFEGDDRREYPRFNLSEETKVFIHEGPKSYTLRDFSVGGMAFFSPVGFLPGAKLQMSAMGLLTLNVEVLSSSIENDPNFDGDFQYLVRTRFSEEVNGYHVFILAKEFSAQNSQ